MADHIVLEGFRAECIIGTYPEERTMTQTVLFSLDISGDFSEASRTDDLTKAVDYTSVEKSVMEYVPCTSFLLLEALAGGIADLILREFPIVDGVSVTISKERKVLNHADVTVVLNRKRTP